MLVLKEIQPINNSMGAQSNILNANFSKPSFRGNNTETLPSKAALPSAADGDKFEKNESSKPKSKFFIAMTALAGASTAGLALTWARLGKILKLVGVAVPIAFFGRLSKVRELSLKDGLTGLFNKYTLKATISKDFQEIIKKKKNYCVAMLDMDNFKGFNEIFDHNKGDKVLKRIADCIHSVTKKHKVNGYRYGGEEFAVLLPNHNSESAKKVLEEIAEAIRKDEYIQGLLPEFKKHTQEDIEFMSPLMTQINEIFAKLKGKQHTVNHKQLAGQIISLVEKHIEKYRPTDAKALKDYIAKLKSADSKGLPNLLGTKTQIGDASTLGNELDKIYIQYKTMKNDREKWLYHINMHNMFTISGGLFSFLDSKVVIDDSGHLLKIADAALKSAKESHKNIIVTANDEITKSVIDEVNKQKAAKAASS
jgi:diguanylate cyclase (GGDEF)-like protein